MKRYFDIPGQGPLEIPVTKAGEKLTVEQLENYLGKKEIREIDLEEYNKLLKK